jgi:hypothetical protein
MHQLHDHYLVQTNATADRAGQGHSHPVKSNQPLTHRKQVEKRCRRTG